MRRRSIWLVVAIIVVVLVAAGAAYASRVASTVNPPHIAPGPVATTAATAATTGTTTTGALGTLRTCQIVPAQSTAAYSVFENLIFENKPNNDAVGTTHDVQGNFRIRTGASPIVEGMHIVVDLRTLQTDSQRRDEYVRENALQTDTYPYATFDSVSTQGLPVNYSEGDNVHFQLIGNMTMHGKTNKETFDVQGKVQNNMITGKATTTIYMTDFDIQPPNLANVAVSQNKVDITITFTAKRV
jgi:polyisoprenoid-binding protein YceI